MRINFNRNLLLLMAFAVAISTTGWAQINFDPERDVAINTSLTGKAVAPESIGELIVLIDLPPSVHITSVEMGFFFVEMQPVAGIVWQNAVFPKGVDYEDEEVFRGLIKIKVPFVTDNTVKIDLSVPIQGTIGYQICGELEPIFCTPPVERPFAGEIKIGKPDQTEVVSLATTNNEAEAVSAENGGSIEERAKRALASGSLLALLWIFLGGVALSFTPCVYPVIPITIAFIGARSGGSRLKGFSLSLVFVLGLGLVYSILGVVAAASGGVFGLSTQSPWVLGFVTLVFLIMGAGMLGAFEMSLPSSVQTKLAGNKRSGYVGALFVGATTGLVAAPCVGPVLVALLSWVSSTGNLFLGFLYLFVFAMGLGVLFVVIGTFAGAMSALPKAGGWMDNVKKVFGVILIAAALYFGKGLVSENLFTLAVGLSLLMFGAMLGGVTSLGEDPSLGRRIGKALGVFILLIGAFYTLLGIGRYENIGANFATGTAIQQPAGDVVSAHQGINWIHDDIDAAFARAKSEDKPLIIDFGAEWCAACKELDHKTFSNAEVYNPVNEKFVALKVDGTKITDEIKAIWERFGVKGLPTVLFMNADGSEIERFEAFRTVEQVMPILDRVSDK